MLFSFPISAPTKKEEKKEGMFYAEFHYALYVNKLPKVRVEV